MTPLTNVLLGASTVMRFGGVVVTATPLIVQARRRPASAWFVQHADVSTGADSVTASPLLKSPLLSPTCGELAPPVMLIAVTTGIGLHVVAIVSSAVPFTLLALPVA